jgi:hypothetical protein
VQARHRPVTARARLTSPKTSSNPRLFRRLVRIALRLRRRDQRKYQIGDDQHRQHDATQRARPHGQPCRQGACAVDIKHEQEELQRVSRLGKARRLPDEEEEDDERRPQDQIEDRRRQTVNPQRPFKGDVQSGFPRPIVRFHKTVHPRHDAQASDVSARSPKAALLPGRARRGCRHRAGWNG